MGTNKDLNDLQSALREAELALSRNQRRFAAFMDNLPGVAFMKDEEGRYLYANRQFADIFGCQPEDVIGKTSFDLVPESIARSLQAVDEVVLREDKPKERFSTLPGPGGGQRWMEIRFPIKEAADKPPILGVVSLDVTKHKQTEDALRESEEKYRLLVESADEPIFTVDADGRYLFINGTAAERIGKKPADLVGKTVWDVFPKDLADRHIRNIRAVISSGKAGIIEDRTVIQGQSRWYRTSLSPVRNHANKVVSALVIARDVTEQKGAEFAVQKSEELFRLTFENAIDAIFWADAKTGTIINCNKAAEDLMECPKAELIGRHFSSMHPPEEKGKHTKSIYESAKGSGTSHVQGKVLTRSGKIVPVDIAASLVVAGPERIVQGIFRDLSEINQARNAVRLSQQRLQTVVSNAPIVLLLADTDGVIQFADGRALASLDSMGERLVGQRIHNICHDNQAIVQSIQAALAGQDSLTSCEMAGRVFNMRMSPLRDRKENVIGLVGVASDITARRKAEHDLDAARLKLMLIREEEQRRLARELHDSVGQQIVAMKLSFASAGLTKQAHQCAELIQEVRQLCYGLYPPLLEALGLVSALNKLGRACEPAICFGLEYPPELENARFSPEREIAIFRIAQEATSNAMRHGKGKTVKISLARQDGQIMMTVVDDGCGFDVAEHEGKGLGLQAMVDRVRSVGGTFDISSKPGRTVISVGVPLDHAPDAL